MRYTIELEQETDGRIIADVLELPGVMVCRGTPQQTITRVQALASRAIADKLEHGEKIPDARLP